MSITYWEAKDGMYEFDYDGGVHSPVTGEIIKVDGEESTEYATIQAWTVASGDWGTNDAAGKMWVYNATADFISNLENNDVIEDSGGTKICDTTGGVTDKTGDVQTAGNWGLGEDPSVPDSSSQIEIDSRSSVNMSDGMAVGETGGIVYALLHVCYGSTINIGTDSEPFHTNADALFIEGSGTYYFEVSEDATGKDASIPKTIINNKDATVYLTSNENTSSWCCEFTDVLVVAGTVEIGDSDISTAVQNITIAATRESYASVTIHENCVRTKATTYNLTVHLMNGSCTADSKADLIIMHNGTFTYGSDLDDSPSTSLDIEMLKMYDGTFYWQPDDTSTPHLANAFIFGGTLDASSTTNNDRDKLLGDDAGDNIYVFEGATLNLANQRRNITISGGSFLFNFGGNIITDRGSTIVVGSDIS